MKPDLRHHFAPITWPRWLSLMLFLLLATAQCSIPEAAPVGSLAVVVESAP